MGGIAPEKFVVADRFYGLYLREWFLDSVHFHTLAWLTLTLKLIRILEFYGSYQYTGKYIL